MSRQKIIDIALGEVGYKEEEKGVSKYNIWFGVHPAEWCAMFCSWVYNQAGNPLGTIDYSRGFAGLYFALKFWRAKGKITKNPLPGDFVIFSWHVDGNPSHVGIFKRFINPTTIETIEGNTSDGNPSDGGCVELKQRNTSVVLCYINPLNLPE